MGIPGYGANNHDIGTGLFLARYQGDKIGAMALEQELRESQARCSHHANPEHEDRCWKCGVSMVAKPGPVKVRAKPLGVKQTA